MCPLLVGLTWPARRLDTEIKFIIIIISNDQRLINLIKTIKSRNSALGSMWVSIFIDWFLSIIEHTRISEIQLHPCQTPRLTTPGLYSFFSLYGKFLETEHRLPNAPWWGWKKRANALSSIKTTAVFIDCSRSRIVPL